MTSPRPLPNADLSGAPEPKAMANNPWADGGEGLNDAARQGETFEAPVALRPGGALDTLEKEEELIWHENEAPKPADKTETNPFLRKKNQDPTESLSKLSLEPTNPWSGDGSQSSAPPTDIWDNKHTASSEPIGPPGAKDSWENTTTPHMTPSPALVSLPSRSDSPGWDEDPLERSKAPAAATTMSSELAKESHVWDDLGSSEKGKAKADDLNLIDFDAESGSQQKPPLPPRNDIDAPAWKPSSSRQPVDGAETYQIKKVQWLDTKSPEKPRTSPILVQNANGPCPLVALVNALTLTTPADTPDTALVQVLRSRDQISLSLLLDAVLDELMSSRRTTSEDALPDVSDLYAFLQSLHTGMNVNPRFIPTDEMVNAYKRTSLTHLHPTERGDLIPGTFENTVEMSLYAAFSIPLIHGWLPPKMEPAYGALERQAASYEDAQNLLFREEELEEKLSNPEAGLNESEQQLYQDILIIKDFLSTSATQITHWGIEVIGKAIRPGTFAILFRNDHFSTLYCHPQTMQLLTLVTDAGFKRHKEIVWETLSDINGGSTEYLSGDFRMVGSGAVPNDDGDEWTTVQKRGKERKEEDPMSPSTEQEDRDLALALQLQEEEDERHRAAEARRRRESILSEQYIEQQGRQPARGPAEQDQPAQGPPVPPRGAQGGRGAPELVPARSSSVATPPRPVQQVRSLIPPQTQGVTRAANEGEDAPPTYEQAAQDRAYQPPVGHPSHANSPTVSRQSTTQSMNAPVGQRPMGRAGDRPPVSPGAVLGNGGSSKERDCVVM